MTGKAGRPKTLDPDSQMVTVPLPRIVVEDLDKLAKDRGMSRNALIREQLESSTRRLKRQKKQ